MNVGLNITQSKSKYNHFLSDIKNKINTHKSLKFINVSNTDLLSKKISTLDILLTYEITPSIFNNATDRLKWIHFGVAGVEKNLFSELIKSKVILTNCSGIHAGPVSEFIMGSILYHCKQFKKCESFKNNRDWKQWEIAKTMVQLNQKTLGIIGYGAIGKATAKLAKQFGMEVIATRRLQKTITHNRSIDSLIPLSEIKNLYQNSDFIAITCPLTPMTKHMISFNEFKLMKENVYIINIARGGIIDDAALINALEKNKISGAALDVFNQEPLDVDHPYFKFDNVFLSPHISGNFPEYQSYMINQFIEQLQCFINEKPLKNRICKKRLY